MDAEAMLMGGGQGQNGRKQHWLFQHWHAPVAVGHRLSFQKRTARKLLQEVTGSEGSCLPGALGVPGWGGQAWWQSHLRVQCSQKVDSSVKKQSLKEQKETEK